MADRVTEAEVAAFVARCQVVVDEYSRKSFENLEPPVLVFDFAEAKKYVRVVSRDRYKQDDGTVLVNDRSGSAWCFVNLETGDVLKPDGWKRPAPQPRGNIRDEHGGMATVGPYGPAYLKRRG